MKKKESTKYTETSKWEKFQGSSWFLFLTFLISIMGPLLLQAAFYSHENPDNFWKSMFRFTIDKYNILASVIGIFIFIILFIFWMFARDKKTIRVFIGKSEDISKNIDKFLKKSKIVFESGINEFDDKHLLAIQRILNALEDKATDIFAIDNSDPIQWWSDTMTGYLALLAKWKALDPNDKKRQVTRIFVYSKNELLSPILAKTMTLHSLMGFKTFIFSKKMYDSVFANFKNDATLIHPKEVLIWANIFKEKKNNKTEEKIELIDIDFNLDEKDWHKVRCYQSFWDIDMDRNARTDNMKICHTWDNYYDEKIDSALIDIWFEFIAYEKENEAQYEIIKKKKRYWEEIPQQHIQFIKELMNNSICCKNANEVKQIENPYPFGIEIKTSSCTECGKKCINSTENINGTKFDFTSGNDVQEMLKEYYYKID